MLKKKVKKIKKKKKKKKEIGYIPVTIILGWLELKRVLFQTKKKKKKKKKNKKYKLIIVYLKLNEPNEILNS